MEAIGRVWGKVVRWIRGAPGETIRLAWKYKGVLTFVAFLVGGGFLSWWSITNEGLLFWGGGEPGKVTPSEVLRNLGVLILGVTGLSLGYWRSNVAERNAKLAEQGHQNERYQTAAKMLGDPVLAVRLGGIYALDRLARDNPETYHVTAMQLFCAFIRNPPRDERDEAIVEKEVSTEVTAIESQDVFEPLRQDIVEIVEQIRTRTEQGVEIEGAGHSLDLSYANLRGAILLSSNLSNANLNHADLSGAFLRRANLTGARLWGANLSGAYLREANLDRAVLNEAILTDADLGRAGLRGADLASTIINSTRLMGADLSGANLYGASYCQKLVTD